MEWNARPFFFVSWLNYLDWLHSFLPLTIWQYDHSMTDFGVIFQMTFLWFINRGLLLYIPRTQMTSTIIIVIFEGQPAPPKPRPWLPIKKKRRGTSILFVSLGTHWNIPGSWASMIIAPWLIASLHGEEMGAMDLEISPWSDGNSLSSMVKGKVPVAPKWHHMGTGTDCPLDENTTTKLSP